MNLFKKVKNWFSANSYRKENLKVVANQLNMDYSATDDFGMINLLKDFKLFRKGFSKKITNILQEKDEFLASDIRIFDYQYAQRYGKTTKTYKQTVFFIQSKALDLPKFYMEPEYFFHRIANFFGINDIDFEAYPEFSKQYLLKSKEEHRLRNKLNEEVLHYFTIEKDWCLEGLNYYLILYIEEGVFLAKDIPYLYEKGKEIVGLFTPK